MTGDLILVDGLFDDRYVHPSWPHDQLDRWYEAPVASLALADGCVLVRVRPGPRPGAPLEVEVLPHGSGIQLANRGRTVGSRDRAALGIARPPGSSVIVVSGSMQVDASPFDRWVSVRDPVAYFGAVLRETLEREGVTIRGGIREEERLSAGAWLRVAAHRTDLLTTVEVTNKRSQNFYAEALLKLLGARLCDDGSFEGGVEALRRFAQRIGVPDGWRLVDGSGMSRDNRLAPRHLVALLLAMTKHRYGGELLRSLPWGGEPDAGRWERRLASPPYRGNVFAKTGTLGGVSALSGYAKARSGRLYVFSILSNEVRSGSAADDAEDRIVRAIVDHG